MQFKKTFLNLDNFIKSKFVTLFIVILVVLSIEFSLLGLTKDSLSNFYLGLGTVFTGAFLTLTIVDTLLSRRNDDLWAPVSKIIFSKINEINDKFVINLYKFLNPDILMIESLIRPDYLKKGAKNDYTQVLENKALRKVKLNKNALLNELEDKAVDIPKERWDNFISSLIDLNNEMGNITINYSNRLNHKVTPHLLMLQEVLNLLIETYNVQMEYYVVYKENNEPEKCIYALNKCKKKRCSQYKIDIKPVY
ncbi:hypothetical protein [Methanobacterium sp.]|uniref:hypothetical protein n=1 Tax=Methanobacterium sp. TaxID=2164 RepID=UPI0031593265